MTLRKQKIILIICLTLLVVTPVFVSAYGLVPCGSNGERACNVTDIFVLVAQVTNWLIAMAGVLAVYYIIGAGFWLIVSVGNEEVITTRKAQLTNAILGLALVMMAYMFINTVVNVMLTRSLVTGGNPNCKLDLTNPLTYLKIDASKCNNLNDSSLH